MASLEPIKGTGIESRGNDQNDPFSLVDDADYRRWREKKRQSYPARLEDLIVEITDPTAPSLDQTAAILSRCRSYNMAIYKTNPGAGKAQVLELARSFGLERLDSPLLTGEDGVTELEVADAGRRGEYIPYSNLTLSWHTDGYYNAPDERVRGFLLHCVRPAKSGGVSKLLDPEIVYIKLRDEDPAMIAALMADDAMTIPANREAGVLLRPDQTGPVYSVVAGRLHMRYTHRQKNVVWKDDETTKRARARLRAILEAEDEYVFSGRLQPGQGLLCNNVLHARSGFEDAAEGDAGRLIYRARFLDRVQEAATP